MNDPEPLIPKHGGYRRLKSFQVSQLVYDVTVRFCNQYIEKRSRTHDQMVQAARSGVQNIAEGSEASATSKKTELKLTQVARSSLEELRLDYEDFLRHRGLAMLDAQHPALMRFRALQPKTLHEVQAWVAEERRMVTDEKGLSRTHTDRLETVCSSVPVSGYQCSSILSSACLAANAALSLLNLACYLLDRQVAKLAADFENEGGFTERLYRVRTGRRNQQR
ncbi:MAG: four helix bundle protein [Chlorobiaceae bacterium]|nr:four helix bundle protein [Chlorobiaceae bacterium]